MFRDLKGTREQRIAKLENNKETFSELVSKLNRDPNFKEEQSLYMEKMRLATLSEKERLADYHTYEDGDVDRPFLNSDTVGDDD